MILSRPLGVNVITSTASLYRNISNDARVNAVIDAERDILNDLNFDIDYELPNQGLREIINEYASLMNGKQTEVLQKSIEYINDRYFIFIYSCFCCACICFSYTVIRAAALKYSLEKNELPTVFDKIKDKILPKEMKYLSALEEMIESSHNDRRSLSRKRERSNSVTSQSSKKMYIPTPSIIDQSIPKIISQPTQSSQNNSLSEMLNYMKKEENEKPFVSSISTIDSNTAIPDSNNP